MKKIITVLLLTSITASTMLTLTACGNGSTTESSTSGETVSTASVEESAEKSEEENSESASETESVTANKNAGESEESIETSSEKKVVLDRIEEANTETLLSNLREVGADEKVSFETVKVKDDLFFKDASIEIGGYMQLNKHSNYQIISIDGDTYHLFYNYYDVPVSVALLEIDESEESRYTRDDIIRYGLVSGDISIESELSTKGSFDISAGTYVGIIEMTEQDAAGSGMATVIMPDFKAPNTIEVPLIYIEVMPEGFQPLEGDYLFGTAH